MVTSYVNLILMSIVHSAIVQDVDVVHCDILPVRRFNFKQVKEASMDTITYG